jgi:Protein of unknown function (DUF3467)
MANRDATPARPINETDPGADIGGDVAGDGCRAFNAVGRYANFFKVGTNALEVVIEFGEAFSDGAPTPFHTRIVTHPVYARALLALLDESLPVVAAASAPPPGTGHSA